MNATTLEDRAARIDKLVTLRSRIDDELRAILPAPAKRTAEQWLAIIRPDDDATQHRAVLEALPYPQVSVCGSPYPERDRETMGAQNKTAPGARSANCEQWSQGLANATEER